MVICSNQLSFHVSLCIFNKHSRFYFKLSFKHIILEHELEGYAEQNIHKYVVDWSRVSSFLCPLTTPYSDGYDVIVTRPSEENEKLKYHELYTYRINTFQVPKLMAKFNYHKNYHKLRVCQFWNYWKWIEIHGSICVLRPDNKLQM